MKRVPLSCYNERPSTARVDTIVIHSIYAPRDARPFSAAACIRLLKSHDVSAHYVIGRRGAATRCIPDRMRAWHAGKSIMPFSDDRRENVNDFSIGIELVGSESSGFTDAQYRALVKIISASARKFPIRAIVGHEHIAPGRKTDPGPLFDWKKLAALLKHRRFRYSAAI